MNFRKRFWSWIEFYSKAAVVIGGVFVIIGLLFGYSAMRFVSNSVETSIYVIEVDEKRGKHGYVYRPLFMILDANGDRIEHSGSVWGAPKPHEAGDTTDGRYDSSSGKILSNKLIEVRLYIFRTVSPIGGFLLLLGGGYLLWRRSVNARA